MISHTDLLTALKVMIASQLPRQSLTNEKSFVNFFDILCRVMRYEEEMRAQDAAALRERPVVPAPPNDGQPPSASEDGAHGHPPPTSGRSSQNEKGGQQHPITSQGGRTASTSGYMHVVAMGLAQLPQRALEAIHDKVLENARSILSIHMADSPMVPFKLDGIKLEIRMQWIDYWHRCGVSPSLIDPTLNRLFNDILQVAWMASQYDINALWSYLSDSTSGMDTRLLAPVACTQPPNTIHRIMEAPSNIFRRLLKIWENGGRGDPVLDNLYFDETSPPATDSMEGDTDHGSSFVEGSDDGEGYESNDSVWEDEAEAAAEVSDGPQESLDDRIEAWLCHSDSFRNLAPAWGSSTSW